MLTLYSMILINLANSLNINITKDKEIEMYRHKNANKKSLIFGHRYQVNNLH